MNTPFSYTITASESPTSFEATDLPSGLTLNSTTGVISGTPTSSGTYSIQLSASNANGAGSAQTLTLNVGSLPEITSPLTAEGMVGSGFNYSITASESPGWFTATGLPSELSLNPSTGVISGTPSSAGTSNVTISADNAVGTGNSQTLVITIVADPNAPPVITSHPSSQTVDDGANVTFTVVASGATSYQWRKDGTAISGATNSTLILTAVTSSNAGSYSVVASKGVGSATSNSAVLTVRPPVVRIPVINAQPVAQTVSVGGTTTFTVNATGSGLSYQWRRNGVPIPGATSATLVMPNSYGSLVGGYSVVITNSYGTVTSNAVNLTITGTEYFGTFGDNGGTFALYVRADRTGVFLGYARSSDVTLVTKAIVLDDSGRFRATTTAAAPSIAELESFGGLRVATAAEYAIEGTIAADGSVSGSISGLGLTLSAPAPATSGSTSTLAGFYESGAAGTSASTYTIIGAAGEAYVATVSSTGADAGRGTVDSTGAVSVTTENNAAVTGSISADATISLTATQPGSSTPTVFTGGNNDVRDAERLINVSTRATAGTGDATLTVGFVVNGSAAKRLLIRGVGPRLLDFGVGSAVTNPLLKLYRLGETEPMMQNAGWSASTDATAIASAAAQLGAFPLTAGSSDAALLVHLAPGVYTAQVSTTDGSTGVALVEVYEVR